VSNISALPGCRVPTTEPETALVNALRDLLERAEKGELRSFVGTGFMADGLRLAIWCDFEPDVYKMLGTLAWLQHEYVHRHANAI
jgi:hypothetical protein